jgi:hypothetical protein
VRLANLVAIKLGINLTKRGGPNANYWLTFPDHDVKNRVRLEYPLEQYLTRMIDEYASEIFSKIVMKHMDDELEAAE